MGRPRKPPTKKNLLEWRPEIFKRTLEAWTDGAERTGRRLASAIGVDAAQIGRWAAGTGRPGAENLAALCSALGVPVTHFFGVPATIDARAQIVELANTSLGALDAHLIAEAGRLSDAGKDRLLRIVRALQSEDETRRDESPVSHPPEPVQEVLSSHAKQHAKRHGQTKRPPAHGERAK